ncbi:phragmoplastin interacting protein 1-like [Phragmites australis]|uniref:phragmoplastin interacting protein 1-like n=1 Tax=Phragmites australis TaxID=29695 RepID=UPI002D76FE3E|nr:phragmoplastin interacting protein 1-like [Phragmites australis]
MVLARKKLKQKLHALVPAGDAEAGDHVSEAQAMKERLASSRRPRPRRPKKSKKSLPEELRQTEEECRKEVDRRREERKKEKKEKRRIRRLMEAAATQQLGGDAEAEAKEETVEVADSAVGSDHPAVAENRKQNIINEEVAEPGAGSDNAIVTENREKNANEVAVTKPGPVGSNNPIVADNREESIKKVYVGGIPYYSSEDDIRSFFEGCGSITAIDCMTFPESGKFRGIAILTFKTDAAAQRALALDGADMGGFFLKIQPYKYNREKEDFAPKLIEGYNRIYVGNLPWDITEDDIKKFFSDCKISSIRFGTDKGTGDFKGYVHVDFSDGTSLAVALKLDQKVIKGRPVRIRCAVPKKDNQKVNDNVNSDPSNNKIRTCYECGTPGHLSSFCPNKKHSEVRACYECGTPGHLSSSCPNKDSEVRTCYECGTPGHLSSSCPNKKDSEVLLDEKNANVDSATASSKKRRTCYECGIPGHLSSACPNKRTADSVSNMERDDDAKAAPTVVYEENKIGDESNSAPSKKRRKCYECGVSGHLSSACPNRKAAEVVCDEEKPDDASNAIPSAIADEKKAGDGIKSAPPKKKKRRTCYECGIAGHLSSECPNKAAAEVK